MRGNQHGLTLVEVVVASAILSLIVLAVIPLFTVTNRGYSAIEASVALTGAAQKGVNQIQHRLVENKRLFDRPTSASDDFLSRITAGLSSPLLAESRQPLIQPDGTLSSSTHTVFNKNAVGNCLLFASHTPSKTFDNVPGAGGVSQSVTVDAYVFNFYYLTPTNSGSTIGGSSIRNLWEWRSVPYVDHGQLMAMEDTLRGNVVARLSGEGVLWAWDPSAVDVGNAFHELSGGITPRPDHRILRQSDGPMLTLIRGISPGGFRWSVSPNAGGRGVDVPGASISHSDGPVPRFAEPGPEGHFPSGFEVTIVGSNAARQVFLRLVLAAQGSFSGTLSHAEVVLASARDLW